MRLGKCLTYILVGSLSALPLVSMASEGSTGSDFLKLNPGARGTALSEAYMATGSDSETLYHNPAGMLDLVNPQIYVGHLAWWEGITYDSFWGVQPLEKERALGAAVSILNIPPFNSTEDPDIASDSAWSLLAKVGYAHKWNRTLAVGAVLNVMASQLAENRAWGLSLDAGAKYYMWNDRLVVAAVLRNLGLMSAFESRSDALPLMGGLGAGYTLLQEEWLRSTVDLDVKLPLGDRPVFALGHETWLWNSVAMRWGVNTTSDTGDWVTCGAGFRWQQIHVDYALKPLGLMGPVHQVSAGYDFGRQVKLDPPKLSVRLINRQVVYPDGETGNEVEFIPLCKIPAGLERWTLDITDRNGKTVKHSQGGAPLPLRIVWDGKNDQSQTVDREAYYIYRLEVVDKRGYSDESQGEILPISITRLPQLKAGPRDIYAGKVTFAPKGSETAAEWSISIMNAQGLVLKKYQGVGPIPKDFGWDGKDEFNHQVSVQEGFHYVMQVKDKAGNEIKSVAPLAQVDAGTKAYAESNTPVAEQLVFRFRLQPEIKFKGWALDIVDADTGKVVRTFSADGRPPEAVTWDSRDDQGRVVALNQKFNYVLRLQDHVGNVWQQASELRRTPLNIVSQEPGMTKIKIDQILFEFNRAELKPWVYEKLRKVADLIKGYPAGKVHAVIEGHTDEIGTEQFNRELSTSRANMVMRYLVEEEGISSAVLEIKGLGKTVPLSTSSDPESMAKNRRVEVTLYLSK